MENQTEPTGKRAIKYQYIAKSQNAPTSWLTGYLQELFL